MKRLFQKLKDRFALWFMRELYRSIDRQTLVRFTFIGDKGPKQIHSSNEFWFNTFTDKFVVDWNNKTINREKK